MLKRPSLIAELPAGVSRKSRASGFEIRIVVGSKKNPGVRGRVLAKLIEEGRLNEAMLVVPFFGPRIRKKNKYIPEGRLRRKRFQEESRIGVDKMKMSSLGALLLSRRALDAIAFDVESHTCHRVVRLGIGNEEVAVATPELADQFSWLRKKLRERSLQAGLTLLHHPEEALSAMEIFHDKAI